MKKLVFILVSYLVVTLIQSCDEEAVTPDPCAGVTETSAQFIMKEVIADSLQLTADTVRVGATVKFEALTESDEYEWHVGSDDRTWTTKSFTLTFMNFEGTIPVRLIAKKKTVNKACFPNDDGIDTITHTLAVVKDYAILGKYKGVNIEQPLDTFVVEVKLNYSGNWVALTNINKGCFDTTMATQFNFSVGNKGLWFYSYMFSQMRATCWDPRGIALLTPDNNHIEIKYSVTDPNQAEWDDKKRLHFTFRGVRQ